MTMHPPMDRPAAPVPPPSDILERIVRAFSVVTLVITVPQAYGVWFGREVGGVSLLCWATYLLSALLWFVYGWRKADKTIYVACLGWIVLDAAIVLGVVVRGGT